jgi:hypothetical protein
VFKLNKRIQIFFFSTFFLFGIFLFHPIQAYAELNYAISDSGTPPSDPWMIAGNGERLNITAGNRSQIRTQSGVQIQLRTNECVQLRINESETNPEGPLLNQTRAVNKFMHIHMNQTAAMNATMFRNYTNQELDTLGNVSTFRWAFYNVTRNQWQNAEHNWIEYSSEGAAVFCNTTHFSIWTILADEIEEVEDITKNPTPGTPFNAQNGSEFSVMAGNKYQIKTQSGFTIQLKLDKNANVTVTEYETPNRQMNRERHQIRTQTMSIESNDSSAQIQANFSYTFTNQIKNQLGINDINQLKFMFYNESSGEWEAPKHQWLEGETLYCNTTHFSLWTVAEEDEPETIPGFTLIPVFLALLPVFLFRKQRK